MQPKTAKQVFDFFPGIWKIARHVTAKMPEQNATAHGYCLFTTSATKPNLVVYSEKVAIHYLQSNTTHIGKQQYQYRYDMAEASLSKHLHNGSLLYKLNLRNDQIDGAYVCMRDSYLSNYIFETDRFRIIYTVDGPLKCYRITSVYTSMPNKTLTALGITIANGLIV
ncbi:MAG: DUF6314 family protein [Candidatus Cardinium sp.]|uniref:DUF6314 family protein n=1 Tax=Candidatus Cardinium sp. TP TaxID=2961955 RepID=UPI0021B04EAD|nr:DUF6314 family protein [Candidatus Cardinium sp. TP]MCT4697093.1 DUF6314 family protein [Candidatus Cardinium sp. TP]